MPYQVSFEGEKWSTDDLTLDEAIAIEKVTGRGWTTINPFRSGEDCKAIMVAFLTRTRGADESARLVGALTLRQVLDSVDVVADDLPNLYEDGLPLGEKDTTSTS